MATDRSIDFVDFARAHRADLVRTAALLCAGDEAWAEDLVQTTLTKLYLSWSRASRADSRLAYARKTLTHAFIDETKRAYRRREAAAADPAQSAGSEPSAPDVDLGLRELILTALAELGPRQRAVVVLRHWHDLDVTETARVLKCSVGTVKSQNARGLARLRELVGPQFLVPEGAS